ncbi:MAG: DinB family protein [Cryomorphaceae bacterium]
MPLNPNEKQILRKHLIESLSGEKAHITIDLVVEGFPDKAINKKIEGIPHSPWDLMEHLRLAQRDIIDFIKNPNYREMEWPDDYWPKNQASSEEWKNSIANFLKDRKELIELIEDDSINLFDPLPYARDYNFFREIILLANHNSYHLGQLLQLKRVLA